MEKKIDVHVTAERFCEFDESGHSAIQSKNPTKSPEADYAQWCNNNMACTYFCIIFYLLRFSLVRRRGDSEQTSIHENQNMY